MIIFCHFWSKSDQKFDYLIIFGKIYLIFLRLKKIENSEFSKHYEKMMLKSNFENCKKTHSDLNSNSNIRVQVRNAGPYYRASLFSKLVKILAYLTDWILN